MMNVELSDKYPLVNQQQKYPIPARGQLETTIEKPTRTLPAWRITDAVDGAAGTSFLGHNLRPSLFLRWS